MSKMFCQLLPGFGHPGTISIDLRHPGICPRFHVILSFCGRWKAPSEFILSIVIFAVMYEYYSHIITEETEAQSGPVTHLRSYS